MQDEQNHDPGSSQGIPRWVTHSMISYSRQMQKPKTGTVVEALRSNREQQSGLFAENGKAMLFFEDGL